MSATTFKTELRYYDKNARDAIAANVRHAEISAPHGHTEYGVAIMRGDHPLLILNEARAYELAKSIADQLTKLRANPTR